MTSSSRRSSTTRLPCTVAQRTICSRACVGVRAVELDALGDVRRGEDLLGAQPRAGVDELHHQLVVGDAEVAEAAEPGARVHQEGEEDPAGGLEDLVLGEAARRRPCRPPPSAPRRCPGSARRRRSGRRRRARPRSRAALDHVVVAASRRPARARSRGGRTRGGRPARTGRFVVMSRSVSSTLPSCMSFGWTKRMSSSSPSCLSSAAQHQPVEVRARHQPVPLRLPCATCCAMCRSSLEGRDPPPLRRQVSSALKHRLKGRGPRLTR